MALITLTELKEEALLPNRDIDLSDYSDSQLQKRVDWATGYVQRKSGRYFSEKEFIQSEIGYFGSSIFLENRPIKSISDFTIDGANMDEDSYILHPDTGELEFTNDEPYLFDYMITYLVSEDPTGDIYLEAADICMDLVFVKLQAPGDSQDIKSFKDSDFSVTFEEDDPMTEIDKRISGIQKPIMLIIED